MAIDHEAHKIRIKAVSDRMNHPMTYNDAGAPRESDKDLVSREMAEYRERERNGTNRRERMLGKR